MMEGSQETPMEVASLTIMYFGHEVVDRADAPVGAGERVFFCFGYTVALQKLLRQKPQGLCLCTLILENSCTVQLAYAQTAMAC